MLGRRIKSLHRSLISKVHKDHVIFEDPCKGTWSIPSLGFDGTMEEGKRVVASLSQGHSFTIFSMPSPNMNWKPVVEEDELMFK